MAILKQFSGALAPLSNMYLAPVRWEGHMYGSAEQAYVAAKTNDPIIKAKVQAIQSPWDCKRFGRTIDSRSDWFRVRVQIMHGIVSDKFTRNPELREFLRQTDPSKLVEVNSWGDTFWGVCNGKGSNWLGRILQEVQQQLSRVVHNRRAQYDVLIARPGFWGNPFRVGVHGARGECVDRYRDWVLQSPEHRRRLPELRDKVLGCWCSPERCHGDVLAWLASSGKFAPSCLERAQSQS